MSVLETRIRVLGPVPPRELYAVVHRVLKCSPGAVPYETRDVDGNLLLISPPGDVFTVAAVAYGQSGGFLTERLPYITGPAYATVAVSTVTRRTGLPGVDAESLHRRVTRNAGAWVHRRGVPWALFSEARGTWNVHAA